jgi:hypothetical protein
MAIPKKFEFERSRGVVWVCDLSNSSRFLNEDQSADDLEQFIQRLYWTAILLVDAAGGRFIKWTGDGFIAWFETPLHRMLGERAAIVFNAVWHLTSLVNITQLGLMPHRKFKIRHGVTYEQDALLIKMTYPRGHESLDLVGRAVVLAFRLSSIPAEFPGLVTQKELVTASANYLDPKVDFKKLQISVNDRLKYFKGERWGTETIYSSSQKKTRVKSLRSALKDAQEAIDAFEKPQVEANVTEEFVERFIAKMLNGPDWCRQAIEDHGRFVEEKLLGSLKGLVSLMDGNPIGKSTK